MSTHLPETKGEVFHFTTPDALFGILTSQRLWASSTTALEDAQELRHCLGLARRYCRDSADPRVPTLKKQVMDGLADRLGNPEVELRESFIVSFCSSQKESQHWTHFGRSGRGFAVGFRGAVLGRNPQSQFGPVVYSPKEQAQEIEESLKAALTEKTAESAINLFLEKLASLAPRMKGQNFSAEGESRLIWVDGNGTHGISKLRARSLGERIVPFREISPEHFGEARLPISSITMGCKIDSSLTRSIKNMLREEGYGEDEVAISKSTLRFR